MEPTCSMTALCVDQSTLPEGNCREAGYVLLILLRPNSIASRIENCFKKPKLNVHLPNLLPRA